MCACMHLRQATRAITQLYDHSLRPANLRATQLSILVGVRLLGPVALSDLADALVIDRTTLSRNLSLLEERGLVRSRPGDDARIRKIELTDRGRGALEEAYPFWRAAQDRVEEALGEAGLDRLLEALADTVALTRGTS